MVNAKHTLDLRHLIKRCPECMRRFSHVAVFCPFDGARLDDAQRPDDKLDPLIGQTIDERYAIENVIGEGGMGTVYCARHVVLARSLAVKVLRSDLAEDAELAARFLQEAQATAAVRHPNVVSITDFGRLRDQRPYFVMELLRGHTLASSIKTGALSPHAAANIAMAIARGLEGAHAARVIHRDLKPENVFLLDDEAKELRVVDFGAALIVGASRLTKAGVVFGTPHYMSPEQAAGKEVDHRADVYALGVILYEMLTGRVPFEGDSYMGVLTQHMFVAPKPPSETSPHLHGRLGALEDVVLRALEKEPSARYATMSELESAIGTAIEAPTSQRASKKPPVGAAADQKLPSLGEIRQRITTTGGLEARRSRARMLVVGLLAAVSAVTVVAVAMHMSSSSAPSTTTLPGVIPSARASSPAEPAFSSPTIGATVVSLTAPPVETPIGRTSVEPPHPPKPPPRIPTVKTINTLPPDPFEMRR